MKFLTFLFLVTIGFSACKEVATSDPQKITILEGDWRGISMTVNNQTTSKNPRALFLRFSNEGQYKGNLGDSPEVGTFRAVGESLYLTNNGQKEVMAKVQKMSSDSLILELTHHQFPEIITFVRRY